MKTDRHCDTTLRDKTKYLRLCFFLEFERAWECEWFWAWKMKKKGQILKKKDLSWKLRLNWKLIRWEHWRGTWTLKLGSCFACKRWANSAGSTHYTFEFCFGMNTQNVHIKANFSALIEILKSTISPSIQHPISFSYLFF